MGLRKWIHKIIKEEVNSQIRLAIRKEGIRRDILDTCRRESVKHENDELEPTYEDRCSYIREKIEESMKWLCTKYGIEIKIVVYAKTSEFLRTKYDEYQFMIKEKGSDEWIDIDKW